MEKKYTAKAIIVTAIVTFFLTVSVAYGAFNLTIGKIKRDVDNGLALLQQQDEQIEALTAQKKAIEEKLRVYKKNISKDTLAVKMTETINRMNVRTGLNDILGTNIPTSEVK